MIMMLCFLFIISSFNYASSLLTIQHSSCLHNSNHYLSQRYNNNKPTIYYQKPLLLTSSSSVLFAEGRRDNDDNRRQNSSSKGSSRKISESKNNNKRTTSNNSSKKGKIKTNSPKIGKKLYNILNLDINGNNYIKESNKDNNFVEPPTISAAVVKPPKKTTKSIPPWQILGKKEMIQNIEREKERRLNIQTGIVPSHTTKNDETIDNEQKRNTNNLLSKSFLSPMEQKYLNWKRFNPSNAIVTQTLVSSTLDLSKPLPLSLGVPEIAILGRSNVGKSSLLNKLAQLSSSLSSSMKIGSSTSGSASSGGSSTSSTSSIVSSSAARVSKTPGATASVNLYSFNDNKGRSLIGFVDLPGYGYAKLSKEQKELVSKAAEHYLNRRKEIVLGILLVDIRRTEYNENDIMLLNTLYDMNIPIMVVATKIDKIVEKDIESSLIQIQNNLQLKQQIVPISSITGNGIRELWQILLDSCEISIQDANEMYEQNNKKNNNNNNDDDDNIDDDDSWYDDDDDDE